ncbi:MAG: hypothetical protein RI964_102 [Pseudomonadota bacterium]|jgi:uncharacterized membrane protein
MKKTLFVAASVLATVLMTSAVSAAQMQIYKVVNVESGGFLNMRSAPGVSSSVITKVPANGDGIVGTGEEKKIGSVTWAKVYWHGKGGWISKSYLKVDSGTTSSGGSTGSSTGSSGVVMKCNGTEPFWGLDITESKMSVNMSDGPRYQVPVTFRQTSANNRTIAVIAGSNTANRTQVFLQKVDSCSDGMSDVKYPYAITAVLNERQVISGCCKVQK